LNKERHIYEKAEQSSALNLKTLALIKGKKKKEKSIECRSEAIQGTFNRMPASEYSLHVSNKRCQKYIRIPYKK
jgi:hypothetical protein